MRNSEQMTIRKTHTTLPHIFYDSKKVALAVLGIFLIKCSTPKSRLLVGDVFLGLSVSTMLGDSLLHILPSVLGKFNPYGQIMENSSKKFSKSFIFRVMSQTVLLEKLSIGMSFPWMSFPTIRSSSQPEFKKLISCSFLMDEFSIKAV